MEVYRVARLLLQICGLMLGVSAFAQQQPAPVALMDQPGHIFTIT